MGEASDISCHEPKECWRNPENNGELRTLQQTCDVDPEGAHSCLPELGTVERSLCGYRGAAGSLKEEAGSSWGMTLIGISCLRMPSRFLHYRCSCTTKSCSFPLAPHNCLRGWELQGPSQLLFLSLSSCP